MYERMRGPEGQCAYERGSKFPGKGLWILKHRKTAPTIATGLPTPTIITTTLPRGSKSERVFLRRARIIHRVPLVLPWFGPDRAFPLAYSHTPGLRGVPIVLIQASRFIGCPNLVATLKAVGYLPST